MATTSTTAQAEALERANLYSTSKAKPTSNSWEDRTVDIGGGQRLWLGADGSIAKHGGDIKDVDRSGDPDRYALFSNAVFGMKGGVQRKASYGNLLATQESAEDWNSFLQANADKKYSLTSSGEPGTAVVAYRDIVLENGTGGHTVKSLPVYGLVGSQPSGAPASTTPPPPKPGATAEDGAADDLYDSSQDVLYGRNGFGARPQLETDVPAGKGTDSVARYGNDMRWRNFEFSDAMNQRAGLESSRMGRMMQYAASTLPAAPKSGGTADLIDALTQLSNVKSKLFA